MGHYFHVMLSDAHFDQTHWWDKPTDGQTHWRTNPLTKPIILSKLSKSGLSQCVFPKGCDIQSHRCVEHVQLDEVKTFEVAHGRPKTKSSVAGKIQAHLLRNS